ncbi:hypothetical protein KZ810_05645 [Sphingomonas sp. RHCKR47]|uniref:hypothetical protein n=1 Tax=Sphingomonas citricola TaxID=2862498 RepID=UPI001CA5554D|nr:hypothetical protein [Sphingomonas citricola]MBW6522975.1 hypothetical protein [Sphingomonas citricola]
MRHPLALFATTALLVAGALLFALGLVQLRRRHLPRHPRGLAPTRAALAGARDCFLGALTLGVAGHHLNTILSE